MHVGSRVQGCLRTLLPSDLGYMESGPPWEREPVTMKLPSSKSGFVKLDRVAADNAKMRSDERGLWAHI